MAINKGGNVKKEEEDLYEDDDEEILSKDEEEYLTDEKQKKSTVNQKVVQEATDESDYDYFPQVQSYVPSDVGESKTESSAKSVQSVNSPTTQNECVSDTGNNDQESEQTAFNYFASQLNQVNGIISGVLSELSKNIDNQPKERYCRTCIFRDKNANAKDKTIIHKHGNIDTMRKTARGVCCIKFKNPNLKMSENCVVCQLISLQERVGVLLDKQFDGDEDYAKELKLEQEMLKEHVKKLIKTCDKSVIKGKVPELTNIKKELIQTEQSGNIKSVEPKVENENKGCNIFRYKSDESKRKKLQESVFLNCINELVILIKSMNCVSSPGTFWQKRPDDVYKKIDKCCRREYPHMHGELNGVAVILKLHPSKSKNKVKEELHLVDEEILIEDENMNDLEVVNLDEDAPSTNTIHDNESLSSETESEESLESVHNSSDVFEYAKDIKEAEERSKHTKGHKDKKPHSDKLNETNKRKRKAKGEFQRKSDESRSLANKLNTENVRSSRDLSNVRKFSKDSNKNDQGEKSNEEKKKGSDDKTKSSRNKENTMNNTQTTLTLLMEKTLQPLISTFIPKVNNININVEDKNNKEKKKDCVVVEDKAVNVHSEKEPLNVVKNLFNSILSKKKEVNESCVNDLFREENNDKVKRFVELYKNEKNNLDESSSLSSTSSNYSTCSENASIEEYEDDDHTEKVNKLSAEIKMNNKQHCTTKHNVLFHIKDEQCGIYNMNSNRSENGKDDTVSYISTSTDVHSNLTNSLSTPNILDSQYSFNSLLNRVIQHNKHKFLSFPNTIKESNFGIVYNNYQVSDNCTTETGEHKTRKKQIGLQKQITNKKVSNSSLSTSLITAKKSKLKGMDGIKQKALTESTLRAPPQDNQMKCSTSSDKGKGLKNRKIKQTYRRIKSDNKPYENSSAEDITNDRYSTYGRQINNGEKCNNTTNDNCKQKQTYSLKMPRHHIKQFDMFINLMSEGQKESTTKSKKRTRNVNSQIPTDESFETCNEDGNKSAYFDTKQSNDDLSSMALSCVVFKEPHQLDSDLMAPYGNTMNTISNEGDYTDKDLCMPVSLDNNLNINANGDHCKVNEKEVNKKHNYIVQYNFINTNIDKPIKRNETMENSSSERLGSVDSILEVSKHNDEDRSSFYVKDDQDKTTIDCATKMSNQSSSSLQESSHQRTNTNWNRENKYISRNNKSFEYRYNHYLSKKMNGNEWASGINRPQLTRSGLQKPNFTNTYKKHDLKGEKFYFKTRGPFQNINKSVNHYNDNISESTFSQTESSSNNENVSPIDESSGYLYEGEFIKNSSKKGILKKTSSTSADSYSILDILSNAEMNCEKYDQFQNLELQNQKKSVRFLIPQDSLTRLQTKNSDRMEANRNKYISTIPNSITSKSYKTVPTLKYTQKGREEINSKDMHYHNYVLNPQLTNQVQYYTLGHNTLIKNAQLKHFLHLRNMERKLDEPDTQHINFPPNYKFTDYKCMHPNIGYKIKDFSKCLNRNAHTEMYGYLEKIEMRNALKYYKPECKRTSVCIRGVNNKKIKNSKKLSKLNNTKGDCSVVNTRYKPKSRTLIKQNRTLTNAKQNKIVEKISTNKLKDDDDNNNINIDDDKDNFLEYLKNKDVVNNVRNNNLKNSNLLAKKAEVIKCSIPNLTNFNNKTNIIANNEECGNNSQLLFDVSTTSDGILSLSVYENVDMSDCVAVRITSENSSTIIKDKISTNYKEVNQSCGEIETMNGTSLSQVSLSTLNVTLGKILNDKSKNCKRINFIGSIVNKNTKVPCKNEGASAEVTLSNDDLSSVATYNDEYQQYLVEYEKKRMEMNTKRIKRPNIGENKKQINKDPLHKRNYTNPNTFTFDKMGNMNTDPTISTSQLTSNVHKDYDSDQTLSLAIFYVTPTQNELNHL